MTSVFRFDDFDLTVKPTSDLYRHVNGGFLATSTIPDDRRSWGSFAVLSENAEKAIREIITTLESDDLASEEGKIAGLYASFMNTERVEALGTEPLAPILERIDAINSIADLAHFWGWSLRHDVNSLFTVGNESDPGDPSRYVMFIGQSGIGLPDEEYYRLDEHASTREQYLTHIENSLTLAGIKDAKTEAKSAFDLETQIAAAHWDKVRTRDMVEMYHLQSWDDFVADAPALLWDEVLAGAELPRSVVGEVVNTMRTFFADVAPLVTEEQLPNWRAWARWQTVNSLSSYLHDALVEESFDFYARKLNGVPRLRDRWKRGVSLVEDVMGEAVGKIYVAKFFPPETKQRVDELVANLLEAYRRSISELDWMGEQTRAEALSKLSKFVPKIGYPSKWRDYSPLQIDADDLVGNVLRAASFEFDHMITQLSGPVDREEWFMYPQTVNAYYHPLRNEIVFPAAILQPPFFTVEADDAVNYGAIGAIIGHEIGHGFDDQGSTCDGDGRMRNWWQESDQEAFKARTASLVDQYDGLAPAEAPDAKVNGKLTLGENIGDLGGIGIAYQAWRISLEGVDEPEPIDGYTGAQRFFVSWAACWQQKIRPEAVREQVATDPHSPAEIRCNQTVKNVDAFHEAFGTKPGDSMWLDPAYRVRIW